MAKIVTNSLHTITKTPFKTTGDKIIDNTNNEGNVLCIYCEVGYMDLKEIELNISHHDVTTKTPVKLTTYCCNLCEDIVLDDKEAKIMRKTLALS